MIENRTSILLLLFLSLSLTCFGQRIVYKVKWKKDSIGYVHADKNGGHYSIKTEIHYSFLFTIDMKYLYESSFENGTMVRAKTTNSFNGKAKGQSTIYKQGEQYSLEIDEDPKRYVKTPITSSISWLYFNEPKGYNRIFSERFGVYLSIEKMAPHQYRLSLPDGKENHYFYENGKCNKVKIQTKIASFWLYAWPE